MIHFFDPSDAKMAVKVPGIAKTVDIMLGNLEDAVPIDRKEAAREGWCRSAKASISAAPSSGLASTASTRGRQGRQA